MKKLLVAVLFFASFGVAMAQELNFLNPSLQNQPLQRIWAELVLRQVRVPSSVTRSLRSVADTLQYCGACYAPIGQCSDDMRTTQDDVNFCSAANVGKEGYCAPKVPRCAGSSLRNTCKPQCKKIPPITATVTVGEPPFCSAKPRVVDLTINITGGTAPYRVRINGILSPTPLYFSPLLTSFPVSDSSQTILIIVTDKSVPQYRRVETVVIPACKKDKCAEIQEEIDVINKRLEAIYAYIKQNPDKADLYAGAIKELENSLAILKKELKKCQSSEECKIAKGPIRCDTSKFCERYYPDTPVCQDIGPQAGKKVCTNGSNACIKERKCLSFSSKISTPTGDVIVTDLKVGDIVWTVDTAGNRIVRPIVKTLRMSAVNHRVVRLVLADGRTLDVSAPHQTADGRTVGELKAGDAYDGSMVQSAALIPYAGTATYDILPAGDTGFYFANGILMGSTLK